MKGSKNASPPLTWVEVGVQGGRKLSRSVGGWVENAIKRTSKRGCNELLTGKQCTAVVAEHEEP